MRIILLSAGAGVCGTGLGGLFSAIILKHQTIQMTCWMLSFAAGIMTSIVFFGLLPEAMALSNVAASISGLILGIVIIMALNRVVDIITEAKGDALKMHHTYEELYHQNKVIQDRAKMLRSGIIMLTAIGFHNIPEGIAIGAGGSHDFYLGAMIAFRRWGGNALCRIR